VLTDTSIYIPVSEDTLCLIVPNTIGELIDSKIVFFPNPVSDELNIVFPYAQYRRVSIVNALCQKIYSKIIYDDKIRIDVSSYSTGIYYCLIEYDNFMSKRTFIKN
jgi:hypothetical protein